jgi:hypothetical protein
MSDEYRTRRLCWIALGVLLPLALWTHAHEDVTRAWKAHAAEPIDVDFRQSITFAGLKWNLVGYDVGKNLKDPSTAEVIVRVQVEVLSPNAVKELGNCWPYLEDSSGQRWSRRPPTSREVSCARLSLRADPDTKQTELAERFVIPSARVPDVTLALVMPKQQPRYLRFQQPCIPDVQPPLGRTPLRANKCATAQK